jgi:hypothetical protein
MGRSEARFRGQFHLEGGVASRYMDVFMQIRGTACWARFLRNMVAAGSAACILAVEAPAAVTGGESHLDSPGLLRALATRRPDYTRYISSVRPLAPGVGQRLYMALVRPGATDPGKRGSAPFAGLGARNDIVYDEAAILSGHSTAWRYLLLDHEYFHARHMAGATLLPVARGDAVELERHYNEAAAWGFNVAMARAGQYTGLREDEFREALDRLSEHYASLRALLKESDPERWSRVSELLRQPDRLIERAD